MAANVETVRIVARPRPDATRYLKAAAAAVGGWFKKGQLGASYSDDVRRATGAR